MAAINKNVGIKKIRVFSNLFFNSIELSILN